MLNQKTLSVLIASSLALSISSVAAAPILTAKPVKPAPAEAQIVKPAPESLCKSITSRKEVINALQVGIEPEVIAEASAACLPPAKAPSFDRNGEPVQAQLNTTSSIQLNTTIHTQYEELTGCGYHPQRRELACVVKLKKTSGYGGTPPYPAHMGSFEWVKFCVYYPPSQPNPGWEAVNTSAVHVHDKPPTPIAMYPPPYHYGVIVQANPRLHQALVNGQTLWARAALSWGSPPSQSWCSSGYWGNAIWLKIKLDP